jgi:hypothetical protein
MTRTTGVLVAAALGAALLGGCGDDGGTPAPPATTASATPTPTPDEKAVVAERVQLYWATTDELSGDVPFELSRLRAVATEDFAAAVGESIRQQHAAGVVERGRTGVVTRSVTVAGGRATVTACVDQGHLDAVDENGKEIENDLKPVIFTITVVRELGVWKVGAVRVSDVPC